MIRHKWIIGLRNKLGSLSMECDSAAAIEGAQLSPRERSTIKSFLKLAIDFIDRELPKPKPK